MQAAAIHQMLRSIGAADCRYRWASIPSTGRVIVGGKWVGRMAVADGLVDDFGEWLLAQHPRSVVGRTWDISDSYLCRWWRDRAGLRLSGECGDVEMYGEHLLVYGRNVWSDEWIMGRAEQMVLLGPVLWATEVVLQRLAPPRRLPYPARPVTAAAVYAAYQMVLESCRGI